MTGDMFARNPKQVKNDLTVASLTYSGAVLSKGEMGAITGRLNKVMGDDINRRTALAWLFETRGEMSSKKLDAGQWYALWEWVGFYQDENSEWQTRPEFPVEAAFVLTEALRAQSKVKPSEKDADLADGYGLVAQAVEVGGVVTHMVDVEVKDGVKADVNYWLKRRINAFIEGKDDL